MRYNNNVNLLCRRLVSTITPQERGKKSHQTRPTELRRPTGCGQNVILLNSSDLSILKIIASMYSMCHLCTTAINLKIFVDIWLISNVANSLTFSIKLWTYQEQVTQFSKNCSNKMPLSLISLEGRLWEVHSSGSLLSAPCIYPTRRRTFWWQ